MERKRSKIDRLKISSVSSAHIMNGIVSKEPEAKRCARAFKLVISKYGTF
jgi:hypothetical protein